MTKPRILVVIRNLFVDRVIADHDVEVFVVDYDLTVEGNSDSLLSEEEVEVSPEELNRGILAASQEQEKRASERGRNHGNRGKGVRL
jgi:hypothetical protein